jgi:hypothetical protein
MFFFIAFFHFKKLLKPASQDPAGLVDFVIYITVVLTWMTATVCDYAGETIGEFPR